MSSKELMDEENKKRIIEAVIQSLANGERLVVVTESQIYAMGSLNEVEAVLKSALKAFD